MPLARIIHPSGGLFGRMPGRLRRRVRPPDTLALRLRATRRISGLRADQRAGFTLIELLTVISIILVLGAVALGAISGAKQRANIARARADLAALTNALEEFKRLYGDYPQLGEFTQAPATPTNLAAGPGLNTAEAMLFNCLTGVYGPRPVADATGKVGWVPLNGPNFLPTELVDAITANPNDPNAHKHLDGALLVTFLVPNVTARNSPPARIAQNVCLLDPWGRRYLYYYKNASNPGQWQAPGPVLYSAGPTVAASGRDTPPIAPNTGLFLATQTAEMLDNIYASH